MMDNVNVYFFYMTYPKNLLIFELFTEISSSGDTSVDATSENLVASESNETTTSGPLHTTTLNTTTIRIKPGGSSSFIPIQEVAKSSTINVTTEQVCEHNGFHL